jgi:hypothetical protein
MLIEHIIFGITLMKNIKEDCLILGRGCRQFKIGIVVIVLTLTIAIHQTKKGKTNYELL